MQTNQDSQRNPSAPTSAPNPSGRTASYLGPGLHIKGEISGNEDLKLDSKVEGLISIGGFRVIVGTNAQVTADIIAREAVISGEVSGDISARDRIEIQKSASVLGDLSTSRIIIEEGAYFKGTIEIGGNSTQIGTDLDSLLKKATNADEKKS